MRKNKEPLLEKLIKQDCQIFDRKKMTLNEYFLNSGSKNSNNVIHPTTNINTDRVHEFNTSRPFNEMNQQTKPPENLAKNLNEPEQNNNLQLRDNINELDNIDAVNNTVDIDAQGGNDNSLRNRRISNFPLNPSDMKNNNIKIFNNYVDKDGTTTVHQTPQFNNSRSNSMSFLDNITMKDYESLTLSERFIYDNRSFPKYFLDNLRRTNIVISIFLKHSHIDPVYIRIAKLVFSLSLIFGTNAIFFTDSYIEKRAVSSNRVINN
jgi:hypothetical protein